MPATPRSRSLARSVVGRLLLAAGTLAVPGVQLTNVALGQLPQTRLYALHPSGGQRGASVELTLAAGADLDDADRLYFSHPGITAVAKTQMVNGKPQPVAGQFTVTIAPEVPVGVYDIRARGRYGLSNPRTFSVGDRKEVLETEPNNAPDQPMAVELNSVVNGRSDGAADIDWYKLSLKAGQRVLVTLCSKRIDSRMDGVVELYHAGRRVAHTNVHGRNEPLLDFTPTADGDYLLKVFDLVYGGGAEYPYRLTVSTGPHVDFIIPASGQPNATGEFTVYGRNLPGGQLAALKAADGRELEQLKVQLATAADPATLLPGEQVSPEESSVDGISFALTTAAGSSNPTTIYFASAPTAIEHEPNDAADKAQKLTVPVEVTGQFQARGDVDIFEFDAKSGAVFWIEVFGQRSSSAADPVLVIDHLKKNEKGEMMPTRITALDDNPLNIGGNQFNTITDDPVFRFAAPADGAYRITLRDRAFENRGDPSLVYRLSIRKEHPDFRLVVIPPFPTADPNQLLNAWDLGLRKGENSNMTVMAFRRDGFAGPIDVVAEGLPSGVTCRGATIPANQNTVNLVFSTAENAPEWFGAIRIIGRSRLDDAAALAAETVAVAARTAAAAALAALDKAVADSSAALKTATDQTAAAKAALDKDANNEALKKAHADASAALAKAQAAAKAATDAKAAGDAKVADANAAVVAARTARDQAARELVRDARGGTIVWAGNPAVQQAAQSRMARSITLAVLNETAQYQLGTDVSRVTVHQGSQILIPMKLAKRAGFDNNVNLTFVAPPQNVQVENKPINKGAAEQVYRVYVQNNVAAGIYTLFAQSQSQVSYSRNPEGAAAAAKEKEAVDKVAAEAAETAKKAVDAKTAAEKKVTDLAAAAKTAADARAAADKAAGDAAALAKAATDEKAVADKMVADAEAAAKAAIDEKAAVAKLAADTGAAVGAAVDEKLKADKIATEMSAFAKGASAVAAKAKEALEKDAGNEALKKASADADAAAAQAAEVARTAATARAAADKAVVESTVAAKKAAEALTGHPKRVAAAADAVKKAVAVRNAADKKVASTTDAAKKAVDAKSAADKAVADADALVKKATEEKAAADKLVADTDAQSKAAAAAKVAADKKATDAANVAKPQNLNTFYPAPVIVVEVKPAPGTLAVNAAGGGALKRGANLEVKVTINRANGFTGPVKLTLPVPPGVAGVSAAEVMIPADKNEGVLVVQATAEATMGQLPNLVVRASMEFDGPASIDQPLAVNIQ